MAQAKTPTGGKYRSTRGRLSERVDTFRHRIELAASAEGPFRGTYALVDAGSAFTWVPARILRGELGLTPFDQYKFVMVNGEQVKRDRAEAVIRLDGRVLHIICVFGEDKDQTLLGAYTLEGFALSVDPVRKRLVPLPVLPAAVDEEPEGGTP